MAARASAARGVLGAVAADMVVAQRAVRSAGGTLMSREISVAPSSSADVAAAMAVLREAPISWVDDGLCSQRAMLGAHMINQRLGAGVSGITDALAAGVIVQPTGGLGRLAHGWAYHAAPVMRRGDELIVLDPLLSEAPLSVREWQGLIDGRAATSLWSPLQTIGMDLPSWLPLRGGIGWHLRDAARLVSASAARAA